MCAIHDQVTNVYAYQYEFRKDPSLPNFDLVGKFNFSKEFTQNVSMKYILSIPNVLFNMYMYVFGLIGHN